MNSPRGMGFLASQQLVVGGAVSGTVDGFRELDFANNLIFAYAGGGTSTGTGILADTANIDVNATGYPNVLAGLSNGSMYFDNYGYSPPFLTVGSNGVLNAWTVNEGTSCGAAVTLLSGGVTAGVADGSGNTYLASTICGTSPNAPTGTWTYGIVKVDGSGNFTTSQAMHQDRSLTASGRRPLR